MMSILGAVLMSTIVKAEDELLPACMRKRGNLVLTATD